MRVYAVACSRSNAATPAAEDSLVVYLAPSVAAADSVQFSAKATVASAEFYTQSVSPLQGVMAAAFLSEGYTSADADSLGLIAGDGLAIRGAAIVADEVTKATVASAEFYTQAVSPLQGVMEAAFLSEGYTSTDADTLGLIA